MNLTLNLLFNLILLQLMCILCQDYTISDDRKCGERPRNMRINRIIGGMNTFYGEVPWHVLLHVKANNVILQCGAVLIDRDWILTAAHCIDVNGGHCRQIEAFFGKHQFRTGDFEKNVSDDSILNDRRRQLTTNSDQQYVTRNATKIIINEQFDSKTLDNDIALIKLNQSVTNEDNIQPICLPEQMDDFSGQSGYISGFGVLQFGSRRIPSILQIVSVPILTKNFCNHLFEQLGHKNVLKTGKLCAGVIDGGKDACAGDSGGPLTVKRSADNKWVLAGLISNGIKCGQPKTPGVYTQVSAYVNWINSVIKSET